MQLVHASVHCIDTKAEHGCMQCTFQTSNLTMSISADTTTYGIQGGQAAISWLSTNASQPIWQMGSTQGAIQAAVKNSGTITARFAVSPAGCCSNDANDTCQFDNSITVTAAPQQLLHAGDSSTFTFVIGMTNIPCLPCLLQQRAVRTAGASSST